jgi:hypothetical protein
MAQVKKDNSYKLGSITNCDISNVNVTMNNNDDEGNCKAFIDCNAALIIKKALIEYTEINRHLCFMINNLKKLSEIVEKCTLNLLQGEILKLYYNINKLNLLITNESKKIIFIESSIEPVKKSVIDYRKLHTFLKTLETIFTYEKILPIYEKDCKKYNIFSKQLIKICNTSKKEIINDLQLIYLEKYISGFYRSAKNPIFAKIEIIAIKYLHKDLPKKSYFQGIKNNPGIIFTFNDTQINKTHKNFLNFLNQICIMSDLSNLNPTKQKHELVYNCDNEKVMEWVQPKTQSQSQILANNNAVNETSTLLAELKQSTNNAVAKKAQVEVEAVNKAQVEAVNKALSSLTNDDPEFINKNSKLLKFLPGHQNIFRNTPPSQFRPAYLKRVEEVIVPKYIPRFIIS